MNIDGLADAESRWSEDKSKIDLIRAMQKILERKKFLKSGKTITPDDTTIEERMVFIEERIKEMRMAVLSILLSHLLKVKLSLLLWLC